MGGGVGPGRAPGEQQQRPVVVPRQGQREQHPGGQQAHLEGLDRGGAGPGSQGRPAPQQGQGRQGRHQRGRSGAEQRPEARGGDQGREGDLPGGEARQSRSDRGRGEQARDRLGERLVEGRREAARVARQHLGEPGRRQGRAARDGAGAQQGRPAGDEGGHGPPAPVGGQHQHEDRREELDRRGQGQQRAREQLAPEAPRLAPGGGEGPGHQGQQQRVDLPEQQRVVGRREQGGPQQARRQRGAPEARPADDQGDAGREPGDVQPEPGGRGRGVGQRRQRPQQRGEDRRVDVGVDLEPALLGGEPVEGRLVVGG